MSEYKGHSYRECDIWGEDYCYFCLVWRHHAEDVGIVVCPGRNPDHPQLWKDAYPKKEAS